MVYPLFGGNAYDVFVLIGNALLVCVTTIGALRKRTVGWSLLCIWAVLDFAASGIELLFDFQYIALQHGGVWVEVRSWLWCLAKLSLLLGLCILAFGPRSLRRAPSNQSVELTATRRALKSSDD